MSNIVQVVKSEILPLNAPSEGKFSFKNGFPLITFQVSQRDAILSGRSVRLNGKIKLMKNDGSKVNNNDNSTEGGVGGVAYNTCFDSRIGVASVFQQITISSSDGRTLEQIRQYPRWLATNQPYTHSQEDLDSNSQVSGLTSSRSANGAIIQNEEVSFSIPLRCGLLSGTDGINLSAVNGLIITLELAPDFQALGPWLLGSGEYVAPSAGAGPSDTALGANFEVNDLSLSYDLHIPEDPNSLNKQGDIMSYNAVSHIYSVINSSDQTTNLNLGTKKTLSVIHNHIPSSFINNPEVNSNSTPRLINRGAAAPFYANGNQLNPKSVSFGRGGVLFPLDNRLEVDPVGNDTNTRLEVQSEKSINALNAVKPYVATNHLLMSPLTEVGVITQTDVMGSARYASSLPDKSPIQSIGVRTDPFRVGTSYNNTNYSLRVQSDLGTGAGGASPNALFTYVLAENVLQATNNGISVSS